MSRHDIITRREARHHACAMIEAGANPDWFVHIVTFPDYPQGTYCSTPIPYVESGMTSRYYRLGDVAAWEPLP